MVSKCCWQPGMWHWAPAASKGGCAGSGRDGHGCPVLLGLCDSDCSWKYQQKRMPGQDQRGEMVCHSTQVTIRPIKANPAKSDSPPSQCSGLTTWCHQATQTKQKPNQALSSLFTFIFLILFLIFIKKTTIIKNESFTGRLQPGRTLISNLVNKMQHSYNP